MRMYTGQARTHGALWPEESEHAWEFYAETPWGGDLARGEGALLIVVDEDDKEDLEALALKISLGLMVERVAFPLDPPEIPEELRADYVPKGELEVKGVVIGRADRHGTEEEGGDLGLISRAIMGTRSFVADFFQDELKRGDEPLKGDVRPVPAGLARRLTVGRSWFS